MLKSFVLPWGHAGHFYSASLHPSSAAEGLVHVNLLDGFKICLRFAVSAKEPSLWVACASPAPALPAKPHRLPCLNKGRWLMWSVKEVLVILGGQPKENKGMAAVTFMVRASRNKTACMQV